MSELEKKVATSVKSAARVLSIFEYFEKRRTPQNLSEISKDLNFPVSSALALLRSIEAMGYLTYDADTKSYFPSVRFAMLGHWIHSRLLEDSAIVQMMEYLSTVTQDTVLLGMQNGLQSQHIHIVHTSQSLSYHPPVGTLRPLLRSVVGRVLLSRQPKEMVGKTVKRINALRIDEGRTFDLNAVMADLEQVRAVGYAYSASMFEPGAAIVGVALPEVEGSIPMALCIGGPVSRISEEAIPRLVAQIHKVVAEFLPTKD